VPILLPRVPEGDAIEQHARERVLTRLRADIAAEPSGARVQRRKHIGLLATAAAAMAVAATVVALTSGLDEGHVAPAASAAAILRQTAQAAERAPAPGALDPGRYLYVRRTAVEPRVIQRDGDRFTVFIRYVEEDWTARDGSGRSRETPAAPAFPTAADRAAWQRAGSPSNREMVGNYLPILQGTDLQAPANPRHAFPARAGNAGLSYAAARALPTDPRRLEALLRRQIGSVDEFTPQTRDGVATVRLLEWSGRLLGGAPLDSGQRAALLRVVAAQPGVRIAHDAVDRLGRRGTAVRLDVPAEFDPSRPPYRAIPTRRSTTLIVDAHAGTLLGTRTTLAKPDGTVLGDYGAVYESAAVASTTQRP
jgi:hypothetical protein